MTVSLIAAMAGNRAIGKDGTLPWRLPRDLRRFKDLTMGHPLIMGRKTYESIGRALPGRRSLVLSRDPGFRPPGVEVVSSLDAAFVRVRAEAEVFVIGGASVFREALPRADRLYLTRIHADVEGDVFFPEEALRGWRLLEEEHHPADDRHPFAFTFETYERRVPGTR